MAASEKRVIGPDDLKRAVSSVATYFDADSVIIVGSQALLVGRNDIAREIRMSEEFDMYPANIHQWEKLHPGEEASEVINALFGEGSYFHQSHGFFIDGVDDRTANLASDWRDRALVQMIDVGGRQVSAIAPEPNDLVASKLARGDPKDVVFARICMRSGLARHDQIKNRLEIIMPADALAHSLRRLTQATHSPGPRSDKGFGIGD